MPQVYYLNDVDLNDPTQLDTFLRTYLPASIAYSTSTYDRTARRLSILTKELERSSGSAELISQTVTAFPNADVEVSDYQVGQQMIQAGDLLTYHKEKNTQVRLPVGRPGQFLCVDPASQTGLAWREPNTFGVLTTPSDSPATSTSHIGLVCLSAAQHVDTIPLSLSSPSGKAFNFDRVDSTAIMLSEPGVYLFNVKYAITWQNVYTMQSPAEMTFSTTINGTPLPTSKRVLHSPCGTSVEEICNETSATFCHISQMGQETVRLKFALSDNTSVPLSYHHLGTTLSCVKLTGLSGDPTKLIGFRDDVGDLSWMFANANFIQVPMTVRSEVYPTDGAVIMLSSAQSGELLVNPTGTALTLVSYTVGFRVRGGSLNARAVLFVEVLQYAPSGWTEVNGSRQRMNVLSTGIPAHVHIYSGSFFTDLGGQSSRRLALRMTVDSASPSIEGITTVSGSSMIQFLTLPVTKSTPEWQISFGCWSCQNVMVDARNEWTDLPLELEADPKFDVRGNFSKSSSDPNSITCSDRGTYLFQYRVSAGVGQGLTARVILNSGLEFREITKLKANDQFTCTGAGSVTLGYNNQVKIQIMSTSGLGSTVQVNGRLTLLKLEKPTIPCFIPNPNVFGTCYSFAHDPSYEVTSGSEYVPVVQLLTPIVPQGIYKVQWGFRWTVSTSLVDFEAKLERNGVEISTYRNRTLSTNTEAPFSDYDLLELSAGVHTFTISYKLGGENNNVGVSSVARIGRVKLEFWRLG